VTAAAARLTRPARRPFVATLKKHYPAVINEVGAVLSRKRAVPAASSGDGGAVSDDDDDDSGAAASDEGDSDDGGASATHVSGDTMHNFDAGDDDARPRFTWTHKSVLR